MENENIEIIESEEIVNEENSGDMEEVLEYSGASGESSSTDSDSAVNDISLEQPDQSLEDLLKQYFSEKGVMENGSSENSSSGISNGDTSTDSISVIDYTELINQLINNTKDQAALESSLLEYYEEYEKNNSLDSPINSISLTNFLIFVVFVGVLFCATIFFARRFD